MEGIDEGPHPAVDGQSQDGKGEQFVLRWI